MNRKSKIIVSVVGIVVVLLALLGLTYAYYLTRIQGNTNTNSISVTSANLKIVYGENNPNIIIKEGAMPGEKLAEKNFTITNSGSGTASYSIIIDNMENDFKRNQDLKYTLTKSGVNDPIASGNLAVGTHQILVPKLNIAKETTETYIFTLIYDNPNEDQSVDMGKTLSLRLNIEEETVTWETATEGTLLYAIKNANNINTSMSSIEDDYGTSYYYKGEVENNYVKYSDKIWRIIRVQGDGTIKIALNDIGSEYFAYTKYDSSYPLDERILFENSMLFEQLKTWKITSNLDTSQIIETDWCDDISILKKEFDNGLDANGEYTNNESLAVRKFYKYYYGANSEPTLKCNIEGLNNSKSVRVKSDIATLTRDEIILSEIVDKVFEPSQDSSTDPLAWYWIMTPYNSVEYYDNYQDSSGTIYYPLEHYFIENRFSDNVGMHTLGTYDSDSSAFGHRPVIALDSKVKLDNTILNQDGTEKNPYIIN